MQEMEVKLNALVVGSQTALQHLTDALIKRLQTFRAALHSQH
jgi:hypothetical protein